MAAVQIEIEIMCGETVRIEHETVQNGQRYSRIFLIRCRIRGQTEETDLVATSVRHTARLSAHRIAIGVVLVHFWFWEEFHDIPYFW